jgi:hypothetical protein
MLNNDRLSHWCAGAVLGWAASFVLLGLPVFHSWLAVPIGTIVAFMVLAACLQLAATPWLFSARATTHNPIGQPVKRTAVVIIWLSLTALLLAYFVLHGAPPNLGARAVFFGTPIVVGTGALIALSLDARHKPRRGLT